MHSNVTIKNVSWPHFSWATLYLVVVWFTFANVWQLITVGWLSIALCIWVNVCDFSMYLLLCYQMLLISSCTCVSGHELVGKFIRSGHQRHLSWWNGSWKNNSEHCIFRSLGWGVEGCDLFLSYLRYNKIDKSKNKRKQKITHTLKWQKRLYSVIVSNCSLVNICSWSLSLKISAFPSIF